MLIKNEAFEETMNFALNQVTMLIDYFSLNSRYIETKQYLYVEISRYYIHLRKKN